MVNNKDQLQQELQEKVKAGVKPSDLKRLKRSKSVGELPNNTAAFSKDGDIPHPPPPPLNSELIALQTENKALKKRIGELEQQLEAKEIFTEAPEENPAELKAQIQALEDQILALRLSKIKEFGEYRTKLTEVEQDLNQQIQSDAAEITNLEKSIQSLLKEKTRLAGEKSLAEWKLSKLELGETNSNWWTDYGPVICLILVAWLSIWLLSKNTPKNSQ